MIKRRQHVRPSVQIWQRLLHSCYPTAESHRLVVLYIKLLLGNTSLVLEHALSEGMILPLDPFVLTASHRDVEGAGSHAIRALLSLIGGWSMHT